MAKELNKFEKEMEKVLLEERARIIKKRDMRERSNKTRNEETTSSEEGDVLIASLEAIKTNALLAHEAKRLKAIESALGRLSSGTYGKCMKCGKKINQERLRAIPQAMLCIDCKNEAEKRNARLEALGESQNSRGFVPSGPILDKEEDDSDK